MSLPNLLGRPGRQFGFAALLAAGLIVPALAGAPDAVPASQSVPQSAVPDFGIAAPKVATPRLYAADSRDAALLTQRVLDLEQQVRDLTGQVQGLQFQLTQLQTLVQRNADDADFRLKALEGGKAGAGGKSDAVTQSGGVTPSAESPPTPAPIAKIPAAPAKAPVASPAPKAAATDDGLGGSLDPLVGKGKGGAAPGTETAPLGALPGDDPSLAETRPLDLQYDPNAAKPANGDAAAQYKAGYDAIVHGDYTFAEDQFKQFLAAYPDDPQAADATNWLGEALLQRQDYVDAADTLVNGYKKYQDSPRAPDMLLNLGIAFAGAKQPEASCKTFTLLSTRFPKVTPAFKTRLGKEMGKAKCTG